jgi:sugar phosphate isomerase/epimerase
VQFGISTHLYHEQRLGREHLAEIAAHGFDSVELFATRTHFDYHNQAAIAAIRGALEELGMHASSLHGPITESLSGGKWGPRYSLATTDRAARDRALRETEAALEAARKLGAGHLVLHLGVPDAAGQEPGDNNREAALKSINHLAEVARPLGVRLALEVIPNRLSSAASLVQVIEEELELPDVGICLDSGHAFMTADLVEEIETSSGFLIATHLHDNNGAEDDHMVPFEGGIDWPAALMSLQKVGYEGALLFELAAAGAPRTVLEKARGVRRRFEQILGG